MLTYEVGPARDYLRAVRLLLNYPLVNWVSRYFSYTRNGEAQLAFVEMCRGVVSGARIAEIEYRKYDMYLTCSELAALDRLNLVSEYINLFDRTLRDKQYAIRYSAYRDDDEFNQYLLYRDDGAKYVHFLYPASSRYRIMRNKAARMEHIGKSSVPYPRMSFRELTQQEQEERYRTLMVDLNRFIERMKSDGKTGSGF